MKRSKVFKNLIVDFIIFLFVLKLKPSQVQAKDLFFKIGKCFPAPVYLPYSFHYFQFDFLSAGSDPA